VLKQKPDVFAWLGDIAYIDYMALPGLWVSETDEKVIKAKLDSTKYDPCNLFY
jgi:hypothetical protein